MSVLAVILALLAVLPALATEPADSVGNEPQELREVVVTGTRTPKLLKDTPVLTRLIRRTDLQRTDAADLQDLLRQEIPGVEFSYAMNQQTNMNLAGFAGQSVLVLLDGERLAGESMENTDFSRLDLNGVERIEIVRGAASALYGSNAAGGVINIITRRPDKPWRANVNAGMASHGQWRAGASLSAAGKHFDNTFDAAFRRIGTYTVCFDNSDGCDFRHVFGHRSLNLRDRLSYSPLPGLKFTGRAGYYFKERLYNPDTPDRYRDFSGGLRGVWRPDSANNLEVSYSFDQYDKSDLIRQSGLDIRDYSNVQHSLRAIWNRTLRRCDILTVGADMMRDYLLTYQFGPGETHTQYTADAFAQYDLSINDAWELIGALRWDYFSDGSDSHLTGKLSARYRIGALNLRGGYSGGFRAPTLKEKYMNYSMQEVFEIHGNRDLRAEVSHNFSLSAEYTLGRNYYFTVGANYNLLHNHISTSGIRYRPVGMPYIEYLNVERLNVATLDANFRASWQCGLEASVSYIFTHEATGGPTLTPYCPARPHSLGARLTWHRQWHPRYATDLTLSGRLLSKVSYKSVHMYPPFDERTITNPTYTLWKLQLAQTILKGLRLTLALDNLLNYTPAVYTYNAPITTGTELMVGISVDLDRLVMSYE